MQLTQTNKQHFVSHTFETFVGHNSCCFFFPVCCSCGTQFSCTFNSCYLHLSVA